ncbi:MAG: hypothetical protein ACI9N1_000133 [Flavobacteriales bacterium]|jgi:hypothetical protein
MKSLTIAFLLFFVGLSNSATAQTVITWEVLKDVQFVEVWSEEFQSVYMVPKFGKKVRSLDNKKIQIRGYVIPVDVLADYYVLSAFPYSSCFFCGQAGPESVMDIQFATTPTGLRTDQIITVEGKLRLNVDDILQLNYILEDVTVIK